jgi:hypothetical protein
LPGRDVDSASAHEQMRFDRDQGVATASIR